MPNLTSQQKWDLVLQQIDKLKELEARLEKLEKPERRRLQNGTGSLSFQKYDKLIRDETRPTIAEIEARYKPKGVGNEKA